MTKKSTVSKKHSDAVKKGKRKAAIALDDAIAAAVAKDRN